MKEGVKRGAFILLIIGTAGLLLNEFVLGWGTVATLVFAVFSFTGLAGLVFLLRSKQKT
jgi:hypothetical protein